MIRFRFSKQILILFFVGTFLGACTYVPFDAPRTPSSAQDVTEKGKLHAVADGLKRLNGGENSVVSLADGNDALGARLQLIEAAEFSLDLQYFLMKPDNAGALVSVKLLEAADRGVRVRLLLDDVFTTAKDKQLAMLARHPNVEVRIFNPLSRNAAGFMNYILSFSRVNRRMHNKAFIADNQLAIVGGRNIADEYYQVDSSTEFADYDLFISGASVKKISQTFDLFWNDEWAVPIAALYKAVSEEELAAIQSEFELRAARAGSEIYQRAVSSAYLANLRAGRIDFDSGKVRVLTDRPQKLRTPVREADKIVGEALFRAMARAKSEIILISPYFVPQDYGARFFEKLAKRGVRVRIVTNSLASNNHPYVHGGYYRHRENLLKAGVELYEIRKDALGVLRQVARGSDAQLTMHTKAVIIDRETLVVGSLNFDPRSIKINAELGVYVDIKDLARDMAASVDETIRAYTFKLRLDERDKIEWVYTGAGRTEIHRSEPGANVWEKFVAFLARILPVESQL